MDLGETNRGGGGSNGWVANCWAEEGREKFWWFETEAGASKCVARGGIGGKWGTGGGSGRQIECGRRRDGGPVWFPVSRFPLSSVWGGDFLPRSVAPRYGFFFNAKAPLDAASHVQWRS
jgi:hypothetical protein